MKKLGQIMNEMGFRPDASQATKEAFVKHLIRASEGVNVMPPTEVEIIRANQEKFASLEDRKKSLPAKPQPVQLSFDFADPKKNQDSA